MDEKMEQLLILRVLEFPLLILVTPRGVGLGIKKRKAFGVMI